MTIALSSDAAARSSFACGVFDSDTEFPMPVSQPLMGHGSDGRVIVLPLAGRSVPAEPVGLFNQANAEFLRPLPPPLPRPKGTLSVPAVEHKVKQVFHAI